MLKKGSEKYLALDSAKIKLGSTASGLKAFYKRRVRIKFWFRLFCIGEASDEEEFYMESRNSGLVQKLRIYLVLGLLSMVTSKGKTFENRIKYKRLRGYALSSRRV